MPDDKFPLDWESMLPELPRDSDADALRRLVATGSDLSQVMDIDFAVDVPDQKTGLAFAAAVDQMGFQTSVEHDDKSGEWTCYCLRSLVPTYEAILAIQRDLATIGLPYKSKPDGWGSFGNASD